MNIPFDPIRRFLGRSFGARFACPLACAALAALPFAHSVNGGETKLWPPAEGAPLTEWGKNISPDKPAWPEYPRPQMVREQWMNLNGLWDFSIAEKEAAAPAAYEGKILVPFPPQSLLSQVNKPVNEKSRVWYRRTFEIPAKWAGQRVLLHFGAVNWESEVTVNGKSVGKHQGGYDGINLDITDALKPSGAQEIVVTAWNPIQGGQPRGKQSKIASAGIFYTATTGIWQSVWLEPMPVAHIEGLKMVPDVDAGKLRLTVAAKNGEMVEAVVKDAGKEVARASGKPGETIAISIPSAKLWWPETPNLYDISVTLRQGGKNVDTVGSYFGMRKISMGPDEKGMMRILLNNKFVFQNGLLDQGFWPDGVYTAPSDAALRFDIEIAKKCGFNMLRKHIKVEPERWYYWADKLGMLVWQDMPSSTEMGFGPRKDSIPDMEGQYEKELREMVKGRFNHPSIVMWIAFNEGWGMTAKPQAPGQNWDSPAEESVVRQKRMLGAIREEDPTRLVNVESGAGNKGREMTWDFGLGDIKDNHVYGWEIPYAEKGRASVIGECGYAVNPAGGVRQKLPLAMEGNCSGIVFTQLTDVEYESNGFLHYDRTLRNEKIVPEQIGAEVIDILHQSGYLNYPGGESKP